MLLVQEIILGLLLTKNSGLY